MMNAKTNTTRFGALAVVTTIAAIVIPAVGARTSSDPGLVARQLGSPDPREAVSKSQYAPGIVARRLGSPDPREALTASQYTAGQIASRLGSPDPRETAQESTASSAIATTLGSPDPQDTARVGEGQTFSAAGGFDWGDFGIGVGFGIGLSAILAGSIILAAVTLRGRSVAQPLA
jgi:hypothetical protein